eukprot:TRINITY_DN6292_c0_g2_i2.p1 TRINITY_DN6292_c0_g2~~TRINITY_DN6292_c0_g2_i2.p1  ORF type:complete len:103 (+),score=9.75 TRINITY_DN6292_c0_g2_i2:27-335(+)
MVCMFLFGGVCGQPSSCEVDLCVQMDVTPITVVLSVNVRASHGTHLAELTTFWKHPDGQHIRFVRHSVRCTSCPPSCMVAHLVCFPPSHSLTLSQRLWVAVG